MSVPAFHQMQKCIAPVWQDKKYQKDVLWAGIFGSVARNCAHAESNVGVLIVLKEHEPSREPIYLRENLAEACGRHISLMCIWQGPDWAGGHARLEALLSSRTVYGDRRDVEHLRQESMTYIQDGLKRLDCVAESVDIIKNIVSTVQRYEDFIHPSQQAMREKCIAELHKLVALLDIKQLHHPIRTMMLSWVFNSADDIRTIINQERPDVTAGAAPVWKTIWDLIQPTSAAMRIINSGCTVGGRVYLRHILASKTLVDRLEEGGQVDDSMYKEILR